MKSQIQVGRPTRPLLAERWLVFQANRRKAGLLRTLKIGRGIRYRFTDIEKMAAKAEARP